MSYYLISQWLSWKSYALSRIKISVKRGAVGVSRGESHALPMWATSLGRLQSHRDGLTHPPILRSTAVRPTCTGMLRRVTVASQNMGKGRIREG